MKFKFKLFENYLTEDIEAVRKQFNYIPEEDFNKIINLDPTYKYGSANVGRYGKWLLSLYRKNNPLEQSAWFVKNAIIRYDGIKNDKQYDIERDISKFRSISDMHEAIIDSRFKELSDRQKERISYKNNEIKKLYEDEYWTVYTPLSYRAACLLGKRTKWCTAMKDNPKYYFSYVFEDGDVDGVLDDDYGMFCDKFDVEEAKKGNSYKDKNNLIKFLLEKGYLQSLPSDFMIYVSEDDYYVFEEEFETLKDLSKEEIEKKYDFNVYIYNLNDEDIIEYPLFVLVNKKDPTVKYQLFTTDWGTTICDIYDNEIDEERFLNDETMGDTELNDWLQNEYIIHN